MENENLQPNPSKNNASQPISTPELNPTQNIPVNQSKSRHIKLITFAVLGIILAAGLVFGGNYVLNSKTSKPSPTPTITPSPTPDPTADWKTYANDKFSFSYPSDWSFNANAAPNNSVSIGQKNKEPMMGLGIEFDLYSRWGENTGKEIYKKDVVWLNQPSILILGSSEQNHLILKTKVNDQDYQLTMWGPSQQTLEENTDFFLKIANTIKLK